MAQQVNDGNFAQEVLGSQQPVLVDFYADWCPPCRMMLPVVEDLSKQLEGKAKVVKVNVDQAPRIAGIFGVQSIPMFAVIDHQQVKNILLGAQPKENLLEAVKPFIGS